METKTYLNLTYGNPTEDFENSIQHNCNGSLNINLTLFAWKNKMESNIKVIESLLENCKFIKNITVEDYNNISVEVCDDKIKEKLLNDKILNSTKKQIIDDDEFGFDDSDEHNTNNTRLTAINNITNMFDDLFFNTSQDNNESDNSSEPDEIFSYDVNSIINRYINNTDQSEKSD